MGNGGELLTISRLDSGCEDHEGQRPHPGGELEVGVEFLFHDRGRERLEVVALFDNAVDARSCRPESRVGKDASVAERSRAELHLALGPADYGAACQQGGDFVEWLSHAPIADDAIPLLNCPF